MTGRKEMKFFVNIFMLLLACILLVFAESEATRVTTLKITRSVGYPWAGRLENGVPFPRNFSGYILRSPEHTYTTPELVGALLDALNGVKAKYPDSCDLYIGDFSKPGGGPWYPKHKSHQNGRDVDLGMYARGNRCLNSFIPMGRHNLDVEKTWCLVEELLHTGMVENIFVDRSIQKLLFKYARTRGYSDAYLDRLFGNCGKYKGPAVISHEPGHRDHLHVRFFAPWSELAGKFREIPEREKRIIAIAQQSFLPQRVLFYVQHSTDLETLSRQLGVPVADLKKWNNLGNLDVLHPGMSLVFYKRHFEVDAVRVALSLDARALRSRMFTRLAMLQDQVLVSVPANSPEFKRKPFKSVKPVRKYVVKKGDTLYGIARKYGVSVKALCLANDISCSRALIKPGQKLVIPVEKLRVVDKLRVHVVKPGDTLWNIARMYAVSLNELMRLNGVGATSTIRPGMKILIPR